MNWYLVMKNSRNTAMVVTIGGMLARQLVRGMAGKSDDVKSVASLTHATVRMDPALAIPGSDLMILMGILLAAMQKKKSSCL